MRSDFDVGGVLLTLLVTAKHVTVACPVSCKITVSHRRTAAQQREERGVTDLIVLWLYKIVLGAEQIGGKWKSSSPRMEFCCVVVSNQGWG